MPKQKRTTVLKINMSTITFECIYRPRLIIVVVTAAENTPEAFAELALLPSHLIGVSMQTVWTYKNEKSK
jgi:hypothetical protein